jgi:hypothetical protein
MTESARSISWAPAGWTFMQANGVTSWVPTGKTLPLPRAQHTTNTPQEQRTGVLCLSAGSASALESGHQGWDLPLSLPGQGENTPASLHLHEPLAFISSARPYSLLPAPACTHSLHHLVLALSRTWKLCLSFLAPLPVNFL